MSVRCFSLCCNTLDEPKHSLFFPPCLNLTVLLSKGDGIIDLFWGKCMCPSILSMGNIIKYHLLSQGDLLNIKVFELKLLFVLYNVHFTLKVKHMRFGTLIYQQMTICYVKT